MNFIQSERKRFTNSNHSDLDLESKGLISTFKISMQNNRNILTCNTHIRATAKFMHLLNSNLNRNAVKMKINSSNFSNNINNNNVFKQSND